MTNDQELKTEIKQLKVQAEQIMTQYGYRFIDERGIEIPGVTEAEKSDLDNRLRAFFYVLVGSMAKPISRLTENDLTQILCDQHRFLSDEPGDDVAQYFFSIVEITYIFLNWLSARGDIQLTSGQINTAYRRMTAAIGIFNDFSRNHSNVTETDAALGDPGRAMYYYDRPTLPAFNHELATVVWNKVEPVANDFINFGYLTPITGEKNFWFKDDLVTNLRQIGLHLYGEHRQMPDEWTVGALKDILTGYTIKDARIFPSEYSQFGTILKAFMDFSVTEGLTYERVAEQMKQAIEEIEPEMIRLGADETRFSADKKWWLKTTNPDHSAKGTTKQERELAKNPSYPFNKVVLANQAGHEGHSIPLSQWKKKNRHKKRKSKKK